MRILDRYVLEEFGKPLVLVLVSFIAIFVVVDLFEHMDFFLDNRVSVGDIARMYLFYIPYITVLTSPVAVLLAAVFSLGKLSRNCELVAMRASGVGLFRIVLPLFCAGVVISFLMIPMGELVVPSANQKRTTLEEKYSQKARAASTSTRFNLRFFDEKGRLYFAKRLDIPKKVFSDLTVLELDSWRVKKRIDVPTARWNQNSWIFESPTIRYFEEGKLKRVENPRRLAFDLASSPEDLAKRQLEPSEMGYLDLRAFTNRMRSIGADVRNYQVDLALKISFPFANLIVILLGAPLALTARRSGMASAFSFGLIVAFLYYASIRVGQTYGYEEFLHPVLAAWIPNFVFATGGFLLLFKVRLRA